MEKTAKPVMRWMKLDDLDQVAQVSDTSKSFIKKFLRGPKSICFVMALEEKIVGIIFYEIGRHNIKIRHIAVSDKYKKTKVATRLVQNIILKLNGSRTAIFAEVPEYNLEAQLFFRKMGFKAIQVIKNTDGDTYKFKYESK